MPAADLPDSFVHLHLHTEYSTLDGAVRIDDLFAKAAKLKMPAVAMTDHGNLFGAIDFYQAGKKAGVKPILGCELYVAPGEDADRTIKKEIPGRKNNNHLTVLAKNEKGWQNLTKLVSRAHLEGFYYKPRTDWNDIKAHSEGLIVLSGCMNGEVNEAIRGGRLDEARRTIARYREVFGDDYYLEMHDHGIAGQQELNAQLLEYAQEFGIKPVAANDVHFLNRDDHEAHDVMICIGTGSMVFDEKRMHYEPELYFKTAKEMGKLFKHCPQALWSTLEIAEKCDLTIKLDASSSEKYPQFEAPDGSPRGEYFRRLCWEGLRKRFGEDAEKNEVLRTRLEYEMGVMEKMGFLSYFLIVWDFIKWAKDNGIPVGPGRGSAAGSLVAYALEITDCDPLRFELIFERFLNPERVSPPDIDVDFCQTRRPEVIDYVRRKYGERCVSQIITFGTLGAKSVLRDTGRVLGMSYGEVDRVAKMIPQELNITLGEAKKKNPDLKGAIESDPGVARLYETASRLEGLTRGTGIHAAGVVIGSMDLDNYVPLTRGNEGETVTQFAMGPLTDLGMLKMDFLGLKTLTVVEDAVQLIRRKQPDFDIKTIPLDDKPSFELLARGQTVAVFQLESGGMMNLCRNFGVETIEHVIALIALYRPGPMDLIPDFIARKKGQQKVDYLHALLEEVSRETYGILIYQEQVQKAANVLAGYSLGAADLLRRAMGKKKPEEMAKQRAIFVDGAAKTNNIPEKKANDIFDLLEKFAGYGFNKSHSAAYGLVTYQTAYLKANWPVEFFCGVLSNELSNTDKIAVFVSDCQSMGIPILPPDVNHSGSNFQPETMEGGGEGIRYGLAAVKGVGEGAVAMMIAERDQGGMFKSMEDFARRVDSKAVNKKLLESLIKGGAFDWTGEHRAALAARIDQVIAAGASSQRDRQAGQFSLFGEDDLDATVPVTTGGGFTYVPPWSKEQMLSDEKDLLGFYVSGHPLDPWRATIESGAYRRIGYLDELSEKDRRGKVKLAAFLQEVTVKYTKTGKQFAIMKVEDFTGAVEMMVWGEEYEKFGKQVQKGQVVEITAKVEKDQKSDGLQLVCQGLKPLPAPQVENTASTSMGAAAKGFIKGAVPGSREGASAPDAAMNGGAGGAGYAEGVRPLLLVLDSARDSVEDLLSIREIVERFPGKVPLHFLVRTRTGSIELAAASQFCVDLDDALLRDLEPWT